MKYLLLISLLLINFKSFSQCWKAIAAGSYHTLGLKDDGTLWAWGRRIDGATGLPYSYPDNHFYPEQVGSDSDWQSIYTHGQGSLAIKNDGTLWGTGLIDSNVIFQNWTQIGFDNNWQFVSRFKALKTDGTIWTWGPNQYGQLGTGSTTENLYIEDMVQMGTDNNWQSIAGGNYSCFAVKTDGTLWAWGLNDDSQLGDGSTVNQHIPIQIGTENNWEYVTSRGPTHALKTDGSLWGWGANQYGQLGLGNQVPHIIYPMQVGTDTDWQMVYSGTTHTHAIKSNNTRWAWGHNQFSQLGDGTNITQTIPIQIGSENDWLSISVGLDHIAAIKLNHTLICWGRNHYGVWGNGTSSTEYSYTPTEIENCSELETAEYNNNSFYVFPNPAIDRLYIGFFNNLEIDEIVLSDLTGRKIRYLKTNDHFIDVSHLKSGVYMLSLMKDSKLYCTKFIKE